MFLRQCCADSSKESELSGLVLAAGAQAALPPVLPLDFIGDKRLLWHHLRGQDEEPFVCCPLLLRDFGADATVDGGDRRGAHKAFKGYAGEDADKFFAVSDAAMHAIMPNADERKQHRVPGSCVWVSSRLALGFIANRCSADTFDQALAILRPAHGAAGGGGAGVAGGAVAAAVAPAPAARRRPLQLLQVWRLLTAVAKRKQLLALISAIKQSRPRTLRCARVYSSGWIPSASPTFPAQRSLGTRTRLATTTRGLHSFGRPSPRSSLDGAMPPHRRRRARF